MAIIEPKILKGTRDFGPEVMAKRLYVIGQMREIFELNGYGPLETPAIEYASTILGKYGDEGDKLIYQFKDQGDRHVALRYDQTVPTARFVAANRSKLAFPFKRYQIGPVWRADKPQKGRYREFVQADIDIIGTDSLLADAEIASVMYQIFTKLGFTNFVIRVNSRKLLDELLDICKVKKDDRIAVIRLLDKLDKVPLNIVKTELEVFLSKKQIDQLDELILSEKARNNLYKLPEGEATKEVLTLFENFQRLGIDDKKIKLDLTLARGLDYYTGVIYEVVIPDSEIGSIAGGGRYDDLTGLFTNEKFPGTGIAFGLDRMMIWLEENGKLDNLRLNNEVLVVQFTDMLIKNIETLNKLHRAGIKAELYLEEARLDKQFKYANKKDIPWVILQGEKEVADQVVMLRDMNSGEQLSMSIEQAIKTIRS